MKPLRVAVIVKAGRPAALERENKAMGIFSYEVESFTWDYIPLSKHAQINTAHYKDNYDLIFHIDSPLYVEYVGKSLPVIYYDIDSTLTVDNHFAPRFEQAKKANLVLVDHDRLERFEATGKPVRRLSHCANDLIFKDYGVSKDTDICFHCNTGHATPSQERSDMRVQLHDLAQKHGWTYRSGMLPIVEYAQSFSRSKITVNVPRTPLNRPHRVFDALACRTCLLSRSLPTVHGDFPPLADKFNYVEYFPQFDFTLEGYIEGLLNGEGDDGWEFYANNGYTLVHTHHTWTVRAQQLREIIHQELGI